MPQFNPYPIVNPDQYRDRNVGQEVQQGLNQGLETLIQAQQAKKAQEQQDLMNAIQGTQLKDQIGRQGMIDIYSQLPGKAQKFNSILGKVPEGPAVPPTEEFANSNPMSFANEYGTNKLKMFQDQAKNKNQLRLDELNLKIKERELNKPEEEANIKNLLTQKKLRGEKLTPQEEQILYNKSTSDIEKGLRDRFLSESKNFNQQVQAYGRVISSAEDASPAGDLALIFNYMKTLDPNSVVRESEFANAAATGSFGERIQAGVLKVLSGERLAPEVRQDFVDRATRIMRGSVDTQKKLSSEFTRISNSEGVDSSDVIVDTVPQSMRDQIERGVQTVTVTNGNETWKILETDLPSAIADGYRRVDNGQ